jgi:hypothetical protein
MKKRLLVSSIAAAVMALVALPASASATVVPSPSSLTFPERQAGSVSDPQDVTVVVLCTVPNPMSPINCLSGPELFTPNPQFSGANPGDFTQTNDCPPAGLTYVNGVAPGTCKFTIRFAPTGAGARTATLTLGSALQSPPPQVSLSGSAVAAPVQPTTPAPTTTPAKKCKKKKLLAAAAKKKCKKKR